MEPHAVSLHAALQTGLAGPDLEQMNEQTPPQIADCKPHWARSIVNCPSQFSPEGGGEPGEGGAEPETGMKTGSLGTLKSPESSGGSGGGWMGSGSSTGAVMTTGSSSTEGVLGGSGGS